MVSFHRPGCFCARSQHGGDAGALLQGGAATAAVPAADCQRSKPSSSCLSSAAPPSTAIHLHEALEGLDARAGALDVRVVDDDVTERLARVEHLHTCSSQVHTRSLSSPNAAPAHPLNDTVTGTRGKNSTARTAQTQQSTKRERREEGAACGHVSCGAEQGGRMGGQRSKEGAWTGAPRASGSCACSRTWPCRRPSSGS